MVIQVLYGLKVDHVSFESSGHGKNYTVQVKVPLSGAQPIRGPGFHEIVSPIMAGGETRKVSHGQEKSQPRNDDGKVDQCPETITETDEYNRNQCLKQHRIQGGLKPGVNRTKEGREIAFLPSNVDQSGSGEEGS